MPLVKLTGAQQLSPNLVDARVPLKRAIVGAKGLDLSPDDIKVIFVPEHFPEPDGILIIQIEGLFSTPSRDENALWEAGEAAVMASRELFPAARLIQVETYTDEVGFRHIWWSRDKPYDMRRLK